MEILDTKGKEEVKEIITGKAYELYCKKKEIQDDIDALAASMKTNYGMEKKQFNYMVKAFYEQDHVEKKEEQLETYSTYEDIIGIDAPSVTSEDAESDSDGSYVDSNGDTIFPKKD